MKIRWSTVQYQDVKAESFEYLSFGNVRPRWNRPFYNHTKWKTCLLALVWIVSLVEKLIIFVSVNVVRTRTRINTMTLNAICGLSTIGQQLTRFEVTNIWIGRHDAVVPHILTRHDNLHCILFDSRVNLIFASKWVMFLADCFHPLRLLQLVPPMMSWQWRLSQNNTMSRKKANHIISSKFVVTTNEEGEFLTT